MTPPPGYGTDFDAAFWKAMQMGNYDATLAELDLCKNWYLDRNFTLAFCLFSNQRLDLLYLLLEEMREKLPATKAGRELLHPAIYRPEKQLVRYLVSHGVPLDTNALRTIVEESWIRELVHSGMPFEQKNDEGFTVLQEACRCYNLPFAKALIEAGADKNRTTESGATLLHLASFMISWDDVNRKQMHRRIELAHFLLEQGLDPSMPNHDGKTPLDFARHFGHTNLVALFSSQPVK